ncbi:hypothetical protein BDR26DRAFT_75419 [Obelidium mucronatum]|nr:hypothetical protein BDR26DRAFT_75419 [Obelidium mucronatum]
MATNNSNDSSSTDHLLTHQVSIEHISFKQSARSSSRIASNQDNSDPLQTSNQESSSSLEGLDHWTATRTQWTQGHKPYDTLADCCKDYKRHESVSNVESAQFEGVYNNLVNGRRFARPVPLTFITAVLIHGWKKEGLWAPPPPEPEVKPEKRPSSDEDE